MDPIVLLTDTEFRLRVEKLQKQLALAEADAMLIVDNATLYYLTGRVFAGYVFLPVSGDPLFFVRRPLGLEGSGVVYIHKPEQIAPHLDRSPVTLALEFDVQSFSSIERLKAAFGGVKAINASPMIRQARACKTPGEIDLIRRSGQKQQWVYNKIPSLYQPGMTDIELQIEIERASRLEGCLGQFRISGTSMELYMANILVGDNADNPTPYDFAMGGAGMDPSLPVGSNGTVIRPGQSIMVDVNGNYTGYMTDMTRTFTLTSLPRHAVKAHECSIRICRELAAMARPGVEARELFHRAEQIAASESLSDYFMGHRQKAGFVGHGLGIEINEAPVIAPRSRDILAPGNVFALEPKFVIPGVGAVGVENTYCVGEGETVCLTNAPEEIISFQ